MRLADIFAVFEEPAERIAVDFEEYGPLDPIPRSVIALRSQLVGLRGSDSQFDSLLITVTGFWEGASVTIKLPYRHLNGDPFPQSNKPSDQVVIESHNVEVTHDRVNLVHSRQDTVLWVAIGFPDFKGIASFMRCNMEIRTRA